MAEGETLEDKKPSIRCACVVCGREATRGSMRHPFCDKCFRKRWGDDVDAYFEFLRRTHS